MRAMILAAGRGTRLGELGQRVPKVLVEVGGEPLLGRQIDYLLRGGAERIVVNTHHLAAQVEAFAAAHPRAAQIEVVFEPRLLGTAGGVRHALALLGGAPIIVLYGDVVVDEPLADLLSTHQRANGRATLTLYRSSSVDGKGTVELGPGGMVTAFREKAATTVADEALINAGLYALDPELLARLPSGVELDFGHDVFPAALERGEPLAGHVLREPVIDLGTPAMLELARERLG